MIKYTKDHEWVKIEKDNIVIIGITSHAVENLGELVYVELPEIDSSVNKGDSLAVVESAKSASDVYSPVNGEVIEVNSSLSSLPEKVNKSPYEDGWIVKLKASSIEEQISSYMDKKEYKLYVQDTE